MIRTPRFRSQRPGARSIDKALDVKSLRRRNRDCLFVSDPSEKFSALTWLARMLLLKLFRGLVYVGNNRIGTFRVKRRADDRLDHFRAHVAKRLAGVGYA